MPTTYKRRTPTPQAQPTQRPPRRRIAGERRPPDSPATPATRRSSPTGPAKPVRPATSAPAAADAPSRWMLVVAVLLLVAVAATTTLVVRDRLQAAEAAERAEALDSALTAAPARAEKAAKTLLSYSHDSIEDDIARTTPFLTTEYAEEYTSTMRDVVADPAKQTKATVTAKVLSSGVVDASPERADVLVFVNQVTESTNSDKPRTALNRAVLTMVERDGRWVVSDLKGL